MFGHPRIALFRNDKPVRIQKKVPRNGLVTGMTKILLKRENQYTKDPKTRTKNN